jgi:hypothetical protein
MRTITLRASAHCSSDPYGEPKLEGGAWTVGFQQKTEIMALQVRFPDRECVDEDDLYKAQMELMQQMQTAIMMST